MRDEAWQKTRWYIASLGVFDDVPRVLPKRWRSSDIKCFLPDRAAGYLAIAIQNLPVRGPWPEVDEEGWWGDVLSDRRARRSSLEKLPATHRDASLRLDRCQSEAVTFTCGNCKRTSTVAVAELCKTFGPDRNIRTIGRHFINCGDKRKRREGYDCDVRFEV